MGKRKVLSEANLSEMLTPGPGQMYGTVKNLLGYDRVLVECADGVTRVCRIRGKMKRRVWIKMGDTVLVAPWDFQQERGDIMFRYTQGQVESLRRSGQLKMQPNHLSRKPLDTAFHEGSSLSSQCLVDSRRLIQSLVKTRTPED